MEFVYTTDGLPLRGRCIIGLKHWPGNASFLETSADYFVIPPYFRGPEIGSSASRCTGAIPIDCRRPHTSLLGLTGFPSRPLSPAFIPGLSPWILSSASHPGLSPCKHSGHWNDATLPITKSPCPRKLYRNNNPLESTSLNYKWLNQGTSCRL